MKFPSNILSIFALHGGTQTPNDSIIDVPSTLSPVVVLPAVLNEMRTTGDGGNVQRTTFFLSLIVSQTNAAGASTTVCVLGPGLWLVDINASFSSNYVDQGAANNNRVFMNASPVVNTVELFNYYANNNTAVFQRQFPISLPVVGTGTFYLIGIGTATNGVAQTINISVSVSGSRLG